MTAKMGTIPPPPLPAVMDTSPLALCNRGFAYISKKSLHGFLCSLLHRALPYRLASQRQDLGVLVTL